MRMEAALRVTALSMCHITGLLKTCIFMRFLLAFSTLVSTAVTLFTLLKFFRTFGNKSLSAKALKTYWSEDRAVQVKVKVIGSHSNN